MCHIVTTFVVPNNALNLDEELCLPLEDLLCPCLHYLSEDIANDSDQKVEENDRVHEDESTPEGPEC